MHAKLHDMALLHAGAAGGVQLLNDFMAADDTFTSTAALHEAIAEDVEQRIATLHLRQPPSEPAASRGLSSQLGPGIA